MYPLPEDGVCPLPQDEGVTFTSGWVCVPYLRMRVCPLPEDGCVSVTSGWGCVRYLRMGVCPLPQDGGVSLTSGWGVSLTSGWVCVSYPSDMWMTKTFGDHGSMLAKLLEISPS